MRHRWSIILVAVGFAVLFVACYFPALFQGQQFGFRDSAHFYYPLYQRVQQEWDAGRVPLWELEENAGMPLLGNPTAAVLYPLKLIYAVLPYAWGARVYIVTHSALAFVAMLVLMRSWGTSWTGSGLSALAFAFGAPVLFQYCNIIYLVGAAWLPLGVHAVDGWVRQGRRWRLVELAVVLSMQTLGGEPQSAYLLGLAGLAYAAGLAWARAAARHRAARAERGLGPGGASGWSRAGLIGSAAIIWVLSALVLGSWLPPLRPRSKPPQPLPGMWLVPLVVNGGWAAAGVGFLVHWRRRGGRRPLGLAWLGLAGAAGLAMALTAAQMLPVAEFTSLTIRAAEAGTHEIYPFSIEPIRFAGLIWPDVLGTAIGESTSWGDLIRLPGPVPRVWTPSLYLGGVTLVLALGGLSWRRGAPWRVWLSAIVVVSTVGSLGVYTSPIWATRAIVYGKQPADPRPASGPAPRVAPPHVWEPLRPLVEGLGPPDPEEATPLRQDGFLRDGDGGVYWLMATILPGFRQFRYPAKLFTLASLGLAALAGLGWDSVTGGRSRRMAATAAVLLGVSAILLAGVVVFRPAIVAFFRSASLVAIYGPFDADGGYAALVRGLTHGMIALGLGLAAILLAARRPAAAGALVLLVSTTDLVAANRHYILTVPQAEFDGQPEVLRIIEAAERTRPAPGPFRVHRLPAWEPFAWSKTRSPDRTRELVQWERDTLQPKYGIPLGVEYAHVVGVAELYELEWYYGGFTRTVRDAEVAQTLNVAVGDSVIYYPRRTLDMWNVRYFIVPMWANGWTDGYRGYAAMLIDAETIAPPARELEGPDGEARKKDWYERLDYRILRNRREHPRAWVVHDRRTIETARGLRADAERQKAMQEISYEGDPIWNDQTRQVYDPWRLAWIESDDSTALAGYFPGGSTRSSESVRVTYPSPQQVELDVTMDSPGMVVLADIYYPGWTLTDNGKPAPIYKVNRAMRGAAVGKGHHHLVYTYSPASFRAGRIVSALGLLALAAAAVGCWRRPVEPALADARTP